MKSSVPGLNVFCEVTTAVKLTIRFKMECEVLNNFLHKKIAVVIGVGIVVVAFVVLVDVIAVIVVRKLDLLY